MIFNKQQQHAVTKFVEFYYESNDQIFQLAGKPGTGKTTVALEMIKAAHIPMHQIKACSYTGQAAINLRRHGFVSARTLHSTLYNPVETFLTDKNGHTVYDTYYNKPIRTLGFEYKHLDNTKLLLIDEGWSVPYSFRKDILDRGIKILVLGDWRQLPPVKDKPAFFIDGKIHELTEIMRQAANSYIILLAELCEKGLEIPYGLFGNDVLVIDEDDMTDQMILGSDVVLCGKNKTRDSVNKRVRELLNIRSDLPVAGERLICKKNDFSLEVDGISLANGLIGTAVGCPGVNGFDGKTYSLNFLPNLLRTPFVNLRADYNYLIAPYDQKDIIKNGKFSTGQKFDFGYGNTVHSYQGSECANLLYMEENLGGNIRNQLNYTAVTRAKQSIIYVKRKKKIFTFY